MLQLPSIFVIQASDASRHAGELLEIIQDLQSENRIRNFSIAGIDDLVSIKNATKGEDLILILLTNQAGAKKETIENWIRDLKVIHPGIRIGEIIVDNVPYENEFITFPEDLRPIGEREDMNAVWKGIERSLKEIFPVREAGNTAPAIDWPKYLKIAGIVIGVIIVFILIWQFLDAGGGNTGY